MPANGAFRVNHESRSDFHGTNGGPNFWICAALAGAWESGDVAPHDAGHVVCAAGGSGARFGRSELAVSADQARSGSSKPTSADGLWDPPLDRTVLQAAELRRPVGITNRSSPPLRDLSIRLADTEPRRSCFARVDQGYAEWTPVLSGARPQRSSCGRLRRASFSRGAAAPIEGIPSRHLRDSGRLHLRARA